MGKQKSHLAETGKRILVTPPSPEPTDEGTLIDNNSDTLVDNSALILVED